MRTFKITLAYDGTGLVGWQRQVSGTSVQGLLEAALQHLDQREVIVTGAGRTDAGVHALGQVASFSLERSINCDGLLRAVNAHLPPAVRVLAAEIATDTFHARFDARRKTYRYRIWNAEVISPFQRHYAWHLKAALDRDKMSAAAEIIEGRHDFAAFQAAGGNTRSTERTVFSSLVLRPAQHERDRHSPVPHSSREGDSLVLSPSKDEPLIVYEVSGNGFLRHMVRTIVGSLVDIGRGRRPVEWMREVLASRDRGEAGPTAPPQGLFLVSVETGG